MVSCSALTMSYWSLEKRNCLQYCRHFLVDNGVFHGKSRGGFLACQAGSPQTARGPLALSWSSGPIGPATAAPRPSLHLPVARGDRGCRCSGNGAAGAGDAAWARAGCQPAAPHGGAPGPPPQCYRSAPRGPGSAHPVPGREAPLGLKPGDAKSSSWSTGRRRGVLGAAGGCVLG